MTDIPAYPGTPRWVKVFGIIGLAAILLFFTMMRGGGGNHGPGRHIPSGGAPSGSVTDADEAGGDAPAMQMP